MKITTNWNDITMEGVNIGVRIKKEIPKEIADSNDFVGSLLIDVYDTMEIVSILKALKECNERAFNKAIEHFIEEELAESREESENE